MTAVTRRRVEIQSFLLFMRERPSNSPVYELHIITAK
jgi:hypothetical protein